MATAMVYQQGSKRNQGRKDRASGRVRRREVKHFNEFVNGFALVDFDLDKASFTHLSTKGTLSKLDNGLIFSVSTLK